MQATLKKIKTFEGHEGPGFNATILIDGVEVGSAVDEGGGGMVYFHWRDNKMKALFDKWLASLPPETHEQMEADLREFDFDQHHIDEEKAKYPDGKPIDKDQAVWQLVDDHQENKMLKRWCKTRVVFRCKKDKKGIWQTLPVPYTDQVARGLCKKLGSELVEIANERFLKAGKSIV